MAVLAVPINKSFDVAPDKVADFLENTKQMRSREIFEERFKKLDKGNVQWNNEKKN